MRLICLFFCLLCLGMRTQESALYMTLDPNSISDCLAFYHLYPSTELGKKALERSFALINKHRILPITPNQNLSFPKLHIEAIVSLVNKVAFEEKNELTEEQLVMIENMADHLKNRQLKGHCITTIEEAKALSSQEVDLARALLVYQFDSAPDKLFQIRKYEASLDLMALQILARLPKGASNLEKIRAISYFIFHEMRFRFPPQSLSIKDIDTYTVLPAVLDSRLGVCLGVSTLYLTLAQRIGLELEIITPPGHIYLSYVDCDGKRVNIETTARGINIPESQYKGLNTIELRHRTMKETVGLTFMNQASVTWTKGAHEEAIRLYESCLPYLENDHLIPLFLGINYAIVGREEEARALLTEYRKNKDPLIVYQDTLSEDYLNNNIDPEGLKAIFIHVDETRESILAKQKTLCDILKKHPKFREGWHQLAITWLQLSRSLEGLKALEICHQLDPTNPMVEYYLSHLYLNRLDYDKAFEHFQNAVKLTKDAEHAPKILKPIRTHLKMVDPKYDICL